MRALRRTLVVLLVLLVLAVVVDRVAARLADGEIESRLASQGFESPDATVEGFPFLTQAARNAFGRIELSAPAYDDGADRLVDVRGTLRDASVESGGVRAGDARLRAVVPFEVIERRIGERRLTVSAAGDEVRVRRTVEVLGRSVTASATAEVRLDGDRVVVEPTSIELEGFGVLAESGLPSAVADAVRARVTVSHPVDVPGGLTLDDVAVVPDGLQVELTGRDVVLDGG